MASTTFDKPLDNDVAALNSKIVYLYNSYTSDANGLIAIPTRPGYNPMSFICLQGGYVSRTYWDYTNGYVYIVITDFTGTPVAANCGIGEYWFKV